MEYMAAEEPQLRQTSQSFVGGYKPSAQPLPQKEILILLFQTQTEISSVPEDAAASKAFHYTVWRS